MPKGKKPPTIKIRRAKAEDVVNVFKLLQRRTGGTNSPAAENHHAAIAYVLDLIEVGYVVVADLSGRLVGAIGCSVSKKPDGNDRLDVALFAIAQGFDASGADEALMSKLISYTKTNGHSLKVVLGPKDSDKHGKLLTDEFKVTGTIYELDGTAEPETEPDEPVEALDTDLPEWKPVDESELPPEA